LCLKILTFKIIILKLLEKLKTKINFTNSIRNQFKISVLIGFFIFFILKFISPFNSNEFHSRHKTFYLLGFGLITTILYFFHSNIETLFYRKNKKNWTVKNEIFSLFIFFLISGTIIYLYNYIFINQYKYSFKSHCEYLIKRVFVFIPIVLPFLVFLRNYFGELNKEKLHNKYITIKGYNKKEKLKIKEDKLKYIKASENYIIIVFLNKEKEIKTIMFRSTLSNVHKQLPFLEKCHRSYLVNTKNIKEIKGNSQNAIILFKNHNAKIPLSKTFYKKILTIVNNNS